MAITTYTELQSAVDRWMQLNGDSAFSERINEWIAMAESEINRRMRVFRQQKWSYTSYLASNTTRTVAMPADFVEALSMEIRAASETDLDYVPLTYVSPDRISTLYKSETSDPDVYTLRRSEMELNSFAGEDMRIRMHYISTWDIATDSTNWLLTNHPDVYLFGACWQGCVFRHNDPRADTFKDRFNTALTQVNLTDERSRDDAQLDVSDVAYMTNLNLRSYNVRTDSG